MWTIQLGNGRFNIGYIKMDGGFNTILFTGSESLEDFTTACELIHYLNGGGEEMPSKAKERIDTEEWTIVR